MSFFYPRLKHCKKGILVTDKEIPEALVNKLGLYKVAMGYFFGKKVSGQKGRLAPCVHWPFENASWQ